ncbi:hypothetical protein N9B54_03425 [Mariniblastus sp.]|nr:hypothetical protein [Mariniblastus sp.]
MSMQASEPRPPHKSLIPWELKLLFCAIVMFSIVGLTSHLQPSLSAQDQDLKAAPELTPVDQGLDETTRLILRTVRDSDPQLSDELANAAKLMIDIRLFEDARFYLGQISKLNLNSEQLYLLQNEIGADFFSSIHANDSLQPEGRELARKVLKASKVVANSPARIDELIKTLNNPDISIRSEAFRKLRRLGEPAVAQLLEVFAQKDRVADFPGIRGALKSMGIHAQGPLLGAARANNIQVQAEALRALGYYRTSESLDVMMRAYLSPNVPDSLKAIALQSLDRAEFGYDPVVIEERLYRRSREFLTGKRPVDGSVLSSVTIWSWDNQKKKLISSELDHLTATRVTAARRAADLYEINPASDRNRELYLLTQLEAAKRIAGPSKKTNVELIQKTLGITREETQAVLDEALKLELVPAAIACCELLEKIGNESSLSAIAGQPSGLIDAIVFGDRHLQFAAMQAIAAIDPQKAYAGNSYVIRLAVFLAQSENRPSGLIGYNRGDLAQNYAATMLSLGLYGRAAASSREFFQTATSDPDLEVLVVTDTLNNPNYGNLIQQLRTDWRTRRLPIALLYRDADRGRRTSIQLQNDPLFTAIPLSLQPDLVATHIERLDDRIKPWKLSNFDRRRQGAFAMKWLAKISSDRERYYFYRLGSREQAQLAKLLYSPGFVADASAVLGSLGTPESQRALVDFASQNAIALEEREVAAAAFAKSVKRGGTLLTVADVQLQYDRYQASIDDPQESRQVLADLLDAIEERIRSAGVQ